MPEKAKDPFDLTLRQLVEDMRSFASSELCLTSTIEEQVVHVVAVAEGANARMIKAFLDLPEFKRVEALQGVGVDSPDFVDFDDGY